MGLLDKLNLKPAAAAPPESISIADDGAFVIAWPGGTEVTVPALDLRDACPCAGCVEEGTGRKLLDRATLPPDVRPLGVKGVGHYAVQIDWSDGHGTGIYSWPVLRRACGLPA